MRRAAAQAAVEEGLGQVVVQVKGDFAGPKMRLNNRIIHFCKLADVLLSSAFQESHIICSTSAKISEVELIKSNVMPRHWIKGGAHAPILELSWKSSTQYSSLRV